VASARPSLHGTQPLLPVVSAAFGVSPVVASLSLSLTTATLAVALVLAGLFSEVWERAPMMTASLALSSLLMVPARAQASALYLLCYYLGSSIGGSAGGLAHSFAGWPGLVAMIAGLLILAMIPAARLTLPPRAAKKAPAKSLRQQTGGACTEVQLKGPATRRRGRRVRKLLAHRRGYQVPGTPQVRRLSATEKRGALVSVKVLLC
jgi:MFS family permease